MDVGLILGDVHRSVSPADHLDGLLRQVDAAQRAGISWIVMGHHYLYGEYRWLQPIVSLHHSMMPANAAIYLFQ